MDSISLLTNFGISSYYIGNPDEAEECFSQALFQVDSGSFRDHEKTLPSNKKAEIETDNTTQNVSEYDEGMNVFDGPLPLLEDSKHQTVASTLSYNIAQTYLRRGLFDRAKMWFARALNSCSVDVAASSILVLQILHCLGYCSYRMGKDGQAMAYYRQALVLVTALAVGIETKAASCNCIGVLYFNQHSCNTDEAMRMFSQSLELYRSCENKDLGSIATVLNNIGRVYYLRSEFNKALSMYQESLQTRKQLLGKDSIDVGATMYNIGQTLHQLGQNDASLVHYKEFLRIAKLNFGPKSRDVALVYKGMAEIHQERSELKMALYFYSQALDVHRAAGGNYSPDVATILNKLGNLCYEMKDFSGAMKHYKEGLQVERAVLPVNHPHIIITMTNIAHIHKQLGVHAKALVAYIKVREMQEKAFGVDCIQLAETQSSIGLMQYHLYDFDSSFDSYQEALRIRRQHLQCEEHPDIASTLNSIGLVLFKQEMFTLAKKCFSESLRIRCKIFGKNHRDVAILWYNIATIHFEIGEDELAVEMYKETLRVERVALGPNHPDVVLTLQHLGQVLQQLGHSEQALIYFHEALDVERQRQEKNQNASSMARILNLLGNVYLQLGFTKQMMDCYVEASRLYKAGGSGDTLVVAGYNFYGLSKTNPRCAPAA